MRVLLAIILVVHGAIHLIGWAEKYPPRVLWVVTTVAFVATAVLLLARHPAWCIVAVAAVLLSQPLVISRWSAAKAGTAANVIVSLAALLAGARARHQATIDREVDALLDRVPAENEGVLRSDEVASLPSPVRRWLEASGAIGRERATTVRLHQRGEMRTSPDAAWFPVVADQYFTTDHPAFLWRLDATMFHVVPISGRDAWIDGHGSLRIRALSTLPIVNGSGPEIDQGAMLRYLGEIIWFPSAAVRPYIRWEPVDATHANATITWNGVSATGTFAFDERGRFLSMTAKRYMSDGKKASLETCVFPATEWRVVRGIEMPVRGSAIWKLSAGDYEYYRWEIVDVEPNVARPYAQPTRNPPSTTSVDPVT